MPTVIVVVATPVLPSGAVTVRRAVYWPLAVYVCVTTASVESTVPSESTSHAYVSGRFSGCWEADPSRTTSSGTPPLVTDASISATGDREPLT
ncbi:hypothetical protein D3C74_380070 [compost metagenome]